MFGLGPMELAIVGVIAVLLFGKRLPEVGRSMGKSIVEVDVNSSTTSRSVPRNAIDDYDEPTAPKFEPPAREPQPTQPIDKA